MHGKNLTFASDVDYIRGRHSWRGGTQIYADWYRANLNNNYLGTYTFADNDAFLAGRPLLYTRSIGDPSLNFFHARIGAYFQDDFRPKKGLTLSPGVRYSYQTRVDDLAAFEPRLGVTWAPTKSGNTTLRASGGIFHGWLDPGHLVADGALRRRPSARGRDQQPAVSRSRREWSPFRLRIPTGWARTV